MKSYAPKRMPCLIYYFQIHKKLVFSAKKHELFSVGVTGP